MYLTIVNSQLIVFFVYILFKKDTKMKKRWNILKKISELISTTHTEKHHVSGSGNIWNLSFFNVLIINYFLANVHAEIGFAHYIIVMVKHSVIFFIVLF